MIRTAFYQGVYAPSQPTEYHAIFGTVKSWSGAQPNGIVYCHGSGDTASTAYEDVTQFGLCHKLGRFSTVIMADLGLQTWGNDTAIARIGDAVAHLRTLGVTGPVGLVAGSMGNANAMAYALAHPDEVGFIAGIIPLTDILDVMGRGASAEVNAAYGGAYSNVTHGPTHNPILLADDLPVDLPIRLWSSPTDLLTPYATAQAFEAARPQTELTDLGNTGHSDASVLEATPSVVSWCRRQFWSIAA